MTSKSKIATIVFAIAILSLLAYGSSSFRERYSNNKENNSSVKKDSSVPSSEDDGLANEDLSEEELAKENSDAEEKQSTPNDNFIELSATDCSNNCSTYTVAEDLKYCQEVCGLQKTQIPTTGCEAITDELEKDYCFKELAISKTDAKICNQISDGNIKKTCQNRILEDVLEKQQLQ